jgi:hypothetical protein
MSTFSSVGFPATPSEFFNSIGTLCSLATGGFRVPESQWPFSGDESRTTNFGSVPILPVDENGSRHSLPIPEIRKRPLKMHSA